MGMGLSICQTIVREVGGEIELDSRPGQGALFRVTLPPASDMPEEEQPALEGAPRTPRSRVLVVDDEPAILAHARRILSAHDVVTADSGRQAIELLEASSFDLVLCDVMMPDLDGVAVYEHLRGAHPGAERKLVFMTGGVFGSRGTELAEREGILCVHKPLLPEELRRLVANRLDAHAQGQVCSP
jgi:CheY-like chemotaxis protein